MVLMKCDTVWRGFHFYMPVEVNGITKDMIIRKNTPLHGGSAKDLPFGRSEAGQRRAFSGQKARQCVPQCILGGVAVLFTVRKHACAPEATP